MPDPDKNTSAEELLTLEKSGLVAGEVVIGELAGLSASGEPLVDFSQNNLNQPLLSISTVAINQRDVGRQVALMFRDGKLDQPLVIGLIHSPLQQMIESFELTAQQSVETESSESNAETAIDAKIDTVTVDGKKVVLEGREEVVLKCGEASITLTKSGKILIRGKYILNRSTGVNRILGGSVQVN